MEWLQLVKEVMKICKKLFKNRQILFFNVDLLGYYNYEKYYIDDSKSNNTTCFMEIYF